MGEIHFDIFRGKRANLGVITLTRPKQLNALTHGMIKAMGSQLKGWGKDPDIHAIFIQGEGERAFCAGGDIRAVYEGKKAKDPNLHEFFWDEYRLNHQIKHYPKPIIPFLKGITLGGGVGISLHASHPVITETTGFAMPETGIGFFPDVGGTFILSHLPKNQLGIYLGLTGDFLYGKDCLDGGLASFGASSTEAEMLLNALGDTHLQSDPFGTVTTCLDKTTARFKKDPAFIEHHGKTPIATYFDEIAHHFAFDSVEEIMNSLIDAQSPWSNQVQTTLKTRSPTSLAVTLKAITKASTLSFDESMKMEYRVTNRFLMGHDFFEGIRALLVDKDKQPQWRPSEIQRVNAKEVEDYFSPLTALPELSFEP